VSDGKIIQFPRRRGAPQASAASADGSTAIPFDRAEFSEIAAHLCAAEPKILSSAERTGGSAVITAFLDYLWELSGGAVAGGVLALVLALAWSQPSWAQAQPSQPSQQSALDLAKSLLADEAKDKAEQLADFAAAEAEIRQLDERLTAVQRDEERKDPDHCNKPNSCPNLWQAVADFYQPRRIADAWGADHPVEVTQGVAAWKPALSAAWWTCMKHMRPLANGEYVGHTHFEPLFQASCPAVEAQYDRAKEVVGYVLARHAAAADLATIGRAAAGAQATTR